MRVGFIGLGHMGRPMALNLVRAGHTVVVNSRSKGPIEALVDAGAISAESPAEVASQVDVLGACLLTPEQSRMIFLGSRGVIEADRPGLVCVDFATIDPMTSRHIAATLAQRKIGYLDAPISGGPQGAEQGTLTIIVGGSEADLDSVRPVLEHLSRKIFYMGPVGAGVTTKLCNNLITITQHVLISEAMVLGVKGGIAPRQLYEVLNASSARSNTLERVVPNHILARDYKPHSTVESAIKDLECATATAKMLGVRLMLPALAQQCLIEAAGRGHAQKDISAVILPLEEIAQLTIGPG